jgi:hypothetical protein
VEQGAKPLPNAPHRRAEPGTGPYVIEHGDVWYRESASSPLGSGLRHVCDATGELAVAHDGSMLLKVGSAEAVEAWETANRRKLAAMRQTMIEMGIPADEAGDVVIVRLPVSQEIVDEINACVGISGRVARLEENLAKIGHLDPSLATRRSYPR